jgi:[acyl-carrier-protein] S-malonyltransferase
MTSAQVETVLAFEGQGARTIPGEPPVELGDLAPVEAQTAIVRHQIARAEPWRKDGTCAVIGQSLGEISALVVAGSLDLDDALEIVRLRAELPANLLEPAADWTMASLTRVRREAAASAAAEASDAGPLWIVGDNGPTDCIVVGATAAFERFAVRLNLTPKTYRLLPVVHPYHTPAMRPVAAAMIDALRGLRFRHPELPVLSPTGPRTVSTADEARSVLVDALVSPVAWSSALARAAGAWPDARWRECGPSASLYRFVWKNGLELDWAEA